MGAPIVLLNTPEDLAKTLMLNVRVVSSSVNGLSECSVSPYGDADLLSDGAEGGQVAFTDTNVVFAHWTGHLTPLTQVVPQVAERLDRSRRTCMTREEVMDAD